MASAKVVLYTSKTLKSGEHPIMLRIIKDRKIKYISLGYNCSPELWDAKNNLPKKKHANYLLIKTLIETKIREVETMTLEFDNENKNYSTEEIKQKIVQEKRAKSITVFEYFDEIIDKLKKAERIGYAGVFRSTKTSLFSYRNGKDFTFNDVNYAFLQEYEAYFTQRKVVLNSVFVFMRTFKTLVNYAKKDQLIKENVDPFKDYSFVKFRRIKTKKRAITKEQMKKIIDFMPEKDSSIFHSKNYFLFSYFCRGINFIDLAQLKWENIKNNRIEYIRMKTKEHFSVGILLPVKEILDYYKENQLPNDAGYIFPILFERHNTANSIYNRTRKILKVLNKDLSEISKLTEINVKLTSYVARHSWATNMKRSGVSTSIISEGLGHETEKVTQTYLADFDDDVIDKASEALL